MEILKALLIAKLKAKGFGSKDMVWLTKFSSAVAEAVDEYLEIWLTEKAAMLNDTAGTPPSVGHLYVPTA